MNFILFDGPTRNSLLPFTYTRPVSEIRIGILTIKEKWENALAATVTYLTEEYLEKKFPMVEFEENIFIDASILPTPELVEEIEFLSKNQLLLKEDTIIAFYTSQSQEEVDFSSYKVIEYQKELLKINSLTAIFTKNFKALQLDFTSVTEGRISAAISKTNNLIGVDNIFVEEGAVLEFVTINASQGPVYIGKDALVMEGSLIRGPFSLGEQSVVKMGSKIYGGTTIGPNCTVGGEVKNVVMFGNSNKGHEGYLGNSVVGEWCNLGADTNSSNMKNNHTNVKLWNFDSEDYLDSGEQFCGAFIGDYSKIGINTMLNTGTVIGVSANVFGSGFPEKHIPSFSWGAIESTTTYRLDKAKEAAEKMCELKKEIFTSLDRAILDAVFEDSKI
tara:strand:+ start:17341 stop:18504 length:1164 start_codon:yes stop_codon:yes gene_type:complete